MPDDNNKPRSIDERIDALTMNLELLSHDVQELVTASKQQGENIDKLPAASERDGQSIRALARIAEIHEHRISAIEGPEQE